MALELHVRYPAQVLPGGADYPLGQARNLTVPGDGTGTPWEADLVNDWLGFFQSLLLAGLVGPNFAPDSCTNPQYLTALRYVATHPDGDIVSPSHGVGAKTFTVFANGTFFGGDPSLGAQNIITASRFVGVGFSRFEHSADFTAGITTTEIGVSFAGVFIGVAGTTLGGVLGLICEDTAEFQNQIFLTGTGRIRTRSIYAANADTHYNVTQGDTLVIRGGLVTASRIYTLDSAGASDGSTLQVRNHTAFTHTIKNAAGTTIATIPAFGPISARVFCRYEDSGASLDWTAA